MESLARSQRYEVVGEIGAGGMGRVFRARDARLGREVALKRLLPSLASDPKAVERFLREARAAAAFSHANAVHVYDVDLDDEGPFIAMELVKGRSLADHLKDRGPLSPREAVRVTRLLGQALCAAHAAGILHRDVKPSNVLLDEQGTPRLSDFGLALFEGRGELTRSLVGTPEYMAPEQAREGCAIDARADVYSLAATLYACLTGDPPRVVRESRIPAPLRPALLTALSSRPEDRYASVDAFLKALDGASSARARRARALLALKLIGAAGALASVVSIGYTLLRPSARTEARAPRPRPPLASTRAGAGPAARPPETTGEDVAPAPKAEGTFQDVCIRKTVINSGYALGFVVNTGKVPLENAHVRVRFYDDQGRLVLDASSYASAQRIEPGGRWPVAVLLNPWPAYARFEATVDSQQLGYTSPSLKLEVVEKSLEPDRLSGWRFFVKARNADTAPAGFPRIAVVVFGKDGQIIGIHDGFLSARTLAPGETSTATFHVSTFGLEPARYEVFHYAPPAR